MMINHKNMYSKSQKETKDLQVKEEIKKTFIHHPAYGHRRLAIELKMNKKKILTKANLAFKNLPLIFHSGRGKEYLSQACVSLLEKMGIKISVSDPGSPRQNGWSESFFSIFKTESGDLNRFENIGELTEYIYGYLNYCNNDRIQLSLKMPPVQFKQKVLDNCLEKRGT